VADIVRHTRADDDIGYGPVAAVDDVMGVGCAMRPAGGIAGVQVMRAIILHDGCRAIKDIDHLIFGRMPMALRGCGTGHQPVSIGTELRQAACHGPIDDSAAIGCVIAWHHGGVKFHRGPAQSVPSL
jgi:hypothetical protein